MLPARPKIFHGREAELNHIVHDLMQGSARIAILGAGGIGKTSLAKAALHQPEIGARYEHRLFIAADSTTTSIELMASVVSYIGLKPERDLTNSLVQHFSRAGPCLLILDNLETPWEPMESRHGVEEFLAKLTDIPHLSLMVGVVY
jgi:ABC-type iron transport system FetAB ATPase subunit